LEPPSEDQIELYKVIHSFYYYLNYNIAVHAHENMSIPQAEEAILRLPTNAQLEENVNIV